MHASPHRSRTGRWKHKGWVFFRSVKSRPAARVTHPCVYIYTSRFLCTGLVFLIFLSTSFPLSSLSPPQQPCFVGRPCDFPTFAFSCRRTRAFVNASVIISKRPASMPFPFAPALFDGFSFDSIRTPFVPHALPPATLVHRDLFVSSTRNLFTLPRLSGIRNSGVVSVSSLDPKGSFKSLSAFRVLNPAPLPFVFQFSNSIFPGFA